MDFILSAIKDLIKYKIVASINTGDKTYDNLINTALLAILTIIFTQTYWIALYQKIKYYYYNYYIKTPSLAQGVLITDANFNQYSIYINTPDLPLMYTTWNCQSNRHFTDQFVKLISTYGKYLTMPIVNNTLYFKPDAINELTDSWTPKYNSINDISSILTQYNKILPLFYANGDVVGCARKENIGICIVYSSNEILKQFVDMINASKVSSKDNDEISKIQYIEYYPIKQSNSYNITIYPDRTFDRLITVHKEHIMSLLDTFVKCNNNEISSFNGFGTYNLGFMLYGVPGTGKTSIIKAICNYLHRNAIIIDMTKIKTKKDFKLIFTENSISKNIFVLEEFDCIQDVIKDRSYIDKYKEIDKSDLNNKYMEVLALHSSTAATEKDKLNKELENIKNQIDNVDNKLTLETMLTVLDGVEEIRNRVLIATTNHIDEIDPALIRGGRFDCKIHLSYFTDAEVREMLTLMFKNNITKYELDMINTRKYRETFTPVNIINICQQYGDIRKIIDILSLPINH